MTITAASAKGPRHLATVDRAGFEGSNAVGISGNTVVAGVPGLYLGSPGAVYLFTKPTGGWHDETQAAKLTAAKGAQGSGSEPPWGISGNTVVAGFGATVNGNQGQSASYVFTKPTTGWHSETQTAKLANSPGGARRHIHTSSKDASNPVRWW